MKILNYQYITFTIVKDGEQPSTSSLDRLLKKRDTHVGKALSIAHGKPLHIIRGEMQYLYSATGEKYLDLVNNVCHVGHSNPKVVEAGQRQMALLNTNTRYVFDGLTDYLERLSGTLPAPLKVGYLVNSGSEANELAVRIARAYTGAHDMVVVEGAYHGHTGMLIDLSPYKFRGPGGKGMPEPWVHVVPIPDTYRGGDRDYASELAGIVNGVDSIAGLLIESMLSCAGQIPLPQGYLESAFELIRDAGGLCIADEVQVGFGRVGKHMWAFEEHRVIPDIVVMGKPIGNGHPMAAVFTTEKIASKFEEMEFFSTFGGNPVSCAIGLAVLDEIEDKDLMHNAELLGKIFVDGLNDLKKKHTLIGDVRGRGLFIGFELVSDHNTLQPAPNEAKKLVAEMLSRNVLLSTDGPHNNVIKIKPPMVITIEDVNLTLKLLDDVLSKMKL
ncbi:aminotransferase class III-fold pyridoxal phosphate-dependent enzyme [Euryarchaeota archaeon]|nr:aminotransferase class III-fold pyridoxal phosphate-dependent enzyme [Euryarchaeota archaeon]